MGATYMKAMRDALKLAKKAICNHARANHICDSLAWENSTINANCGNILCSHRGLCEAKTAIQNVLAKPVRNCDRFNTGDPLKDAEDAYSAWQQYCDDPSIPPSCKVESAFKNLLFASATEQKGKAE